MSFNDIVKMQIVKNKSISKYSEYSDERQLKEDVDYLIEHFAIHTKRIGHRVLRARKMNPLVEDKGNYVAISIPIDTDVINDVVQLDIFVSETPMPNLYCQLTIVTSDENGYETIKTENTVINYYSIDTGVGRLEEWVDDVFNQLMGY